MTLPLTAIAIAPSANPRPSRQRHDLSANMYKPFNSLRNYFADLAFPLAELLFIGDGFRLIINSRFPSGEKTAALLPRSESWPANSSGSSRVSASIQKIWFRFTNFATGCANKMRFEFLLHDKFQMFLPSKRVTKPCLAPRASTIPISCLSLPLRCPLKAMRRLSGDHEKYQKNDLYGAFPSSNSAIRLPSTRSNTNKLASFPSG